MFYFMALQLLAYTFYPPRAQFVSQTTRFHSWVVVAPESGRFWFHVGAEEGEAAFGDLVFAAPHGRFDRCALEPISYHVFRFEAEPSNEMPLRAGQSQINDGARLASDYALLRALKMQIGQRAQGRRENLLNDLLHLVWESADPIERAPDSLMRQAARLLRERAPSAFSMRDVSGAVGLSPAQFTRRFRVAHGQTPQEFLTARRLETARELLLDSDLSVEQIAQKCGYASGFYLSNLFRRNFGLAPGQFRRGHRV